MDKLADSLTALHPDLIQFQTLHCQHTGKPCGVISSEEIAACVKAHGFKIAVHLLSLKQKSVAAEWIFTNAEGLESLAMHQPVEYFIYAICTVLNPPQDACEIDNSLADFQQRIHAWKQLQSIDHAIIKPIAELTRRLINKAPPIVIRARLSKLTYISLSQIVSSFASLTRYQLACEKLLTALIKNPYKQKSENIHGFSTFKQQSRITALTELELAVFNEFNDFTLIPDKAPASVDVICGRHYGKLHRGKDKKEPKFAGKSYGTRKAGFVLNLANGSKEGKGESQ